MLGLAKSVVTTRKPAIIMPNVCPAKMTSTARYTGNQKKNPSRAMKPATIATSASTLSGTSLAPVLRATPWSEIANGPTVASSAGAADGDAEARGIIGFVQLNVPCPVVPLACGFPSMLNVPPGVEILTFPGLAETFVSERCVETDVTFPPNDVMIATTTTASIAHAVKRRHQPAQSRGSTWAVPGAGSAGGSSLRSRKNHASAVV